MKRRHKYTGVLCVYRDSMFREVLSADIFLDNGREFYYYRAPKCFIGLVDGWENVIDITFTAEGNGKNPRGVKALSAPRQVRKPRK